MERRIRWVPAQPAGGRVRQAQSVAESVEQTVSREELRGMPVHQLVTDPQADERPGPFTNPARGAQVPLQTRVLADQPSGRGRVASSYRR